MSKKLKFKKIMFFSSLFIVISSALLIGGNNIIEEKNARKIESEKLKKEKEFLHYQDERESLKKLNIKNLLDSENSKIDHMISDLAEDDKNYGIYYESFDDGQVVESNSDRSFKAASTIKVCLVMKVADLMNSGKVNENGEMRYRSSDFEGGTGILQGNSIKLNSPIKYKELMKLAIVYSDNIATRMLLREFGQVNDYIYEITGTERKCGGNYITAAQQGKLLKHLYKNENKNPIYNEIKDWLTKTVFHDRLDKYLPNEIVAHKIGTYGAFTHDTGIIYINRPYSLSVYTESRGTSGMANLSKNIYNLKLETNKKINNEKNNCKIDIEKKRKEIFGEDKNI